VCALRVRPVAVSSAILEPWNTDRSSKVPRQNLHCTHIHSCLRLVNCGCSSRMFCSELASLHHKQTQSEFSRRATCTTTQTQHSLQGPYLSIRLSLAFLDVFRDRRDLFLH
jgi:hypothetical protein